MLYWFFGSAGRYLVEHLGTVNAPYLVSEHIDRTCHIGGLHV